MGCKNSRPIEIAPARPPARPTHSRSPDAQGQPSPSETTAVHDFDAAERLSGCGHVSVLHCSIKQVAADAVLIPDTWKPGKDDLPAWQDEAARIDANGRLVYQGCLLPKDATHQRTDEIRDVVVGFVKHAGQRLNGTTSNFKRLKPLIALALPGAGELDPEDLMTEQGELVEHLLPLLFSAANRYGVDFAVTTTEAGAYSVMQVLREKLCPWEDGPFWMLTDRQLMHAKRLCRETHRGRIAVFFGAGVSVPSGLPDWRGLLDELQSGLVREGKITESDKTDMQELDVLDQATLIQMEMGQGRLKEAVGAITSKGLFTPAHALMGALKTTNYDSLYELARGGRVMRLPWDAPLLGSPQDDKDTNKLLKLHGCVTHPNSIVLTREDYLRYGDDREALRGLVSRSLLEKEMLVVGFSMTDANLHIAIDRCKKVWLDAQYADDDDGAPANLNEAVEDAVEAVGGAAEKVGVAMSMAARSIATKSLSLTTAKWRAAARDPRRAKHKKMGTILTLVVNSMFTKLWSKEFHVVACCAEDADDAQLEGVPCTPDGVNCFAYGAWINDCFLDVMNFLLEVDRAHDAFILDSRYVNMLDKQQHAARDALQPLINLYNDEECRNSETWETIVELLEKMGQTFDYDGDRPRPVDHTTLTHAERKRLALARTGSRWAMDAPGIRTERSRSREDRASGEA